MKHLITTILSFISLLIPSCLYAGIPEGYYSTVDRQKNTQLKAALQAVIQSHEVLGYDNLWQYYPLSYYHLDDKTRVWDMYSDNIRYYNGTSAVANMNKEHTVPKSWWGGSTASAPGNDLYNVIPADQYANGQKSNFSLGLVTSVTYTNDVSTVGSGIVNGHNAKFFEPDDRYKGDFARIYFYMATCYPEYGWDENNADAMTNKSPLTLQDWIIPMLIEWSMMDPVDEAEIQRNEDVSQFQNNRNPFIDYPVLVDYIWGEKKDQQFLLSDHRPNEGSTSLLYAGIPSFSIVGGTQDAPKGVKEGTQVTIKGSSSKTMLYTRVNGGDWTMSEPETRYYSGTPTIVSPQITIGIDGTICIEAFCSQDGRENSDTLCYYYQVIDYDKEYLLYEAFDDVVSGNNISTSGSSTKWYGNSNFPTVSTTYQAGHAIKLGTGSSAGSITSRPLDTDGGHLFVTIGVKGWSDIEGKLEVSVSGAKSQTVAYTHKMADEFQIIKLVFDVDTTNPTITVATTSRRAFINLVAVTDHSPASLLSPVTFRQQSSHDTYYNINGQKISGQPALPGLYIFNGRKIVVR